MAGGRPPKRNQLIEGTEGSEQAKERLRAILDTLSGERQVRVASRDLGVNEARFYHVRNRFLKEAVKSLEDRPPGVKPKYPREAMEEIQSLKDRVAQLESELKHSQVREEIALVTPRAMSRAEKKGFRGGR